MTPPEPDRLERTRGFWDAKSKWNAHVAIYDNEDVRDPEKRDAAFSEAGERDAAKLSGFVHPEMRVVDLGCGIGRVMRPLAPQCREIIGVDISESMLEMARTYLVGVPQARLVQTDGASLPSIEDGSVDFLYSLLCLIHVDRRSAYRYMREIERVLRPQGMAFLEFQNILTPEGLTKFQSVVEGDYPLELYTLDELSWLLGSVGLEILSVHPTAEYLHLSVVRGAREEWQRRIAEDVSVSEIAVRGLFADEPAATEGRFSARIRSRLPWPLSFTLSTGLVTAGLEPWLQVRALCPLDPGREHALELHWDAATGVVSTTLDGKACALFGSGPACQPARGMASHQVGLLPPGFQWNEETLGLFPHLFYAREVSVS